MSACDDILPLVKEDFGALWHCKPRGKSLEIITPFSTNTRKCVSIFVSFREAEIIISDGGWLEDEEDFYGLGEKFERSDLEFYADHFSVIHRVSFATKPDKKRVFFKKCSDRKLISGLIYDVANFVTAVVNALSMPRESDDESAGETFRQQANSHFLARFQNVKFRSPIEGVKSHRYSVVIAPSPSSLALISYVTGSTPRYFGRELSNAICGFQVANRSSSKPYIRTRVALLDNSAMGYVPARIEDDLALLPEHDVVAVRWTERENIDALIA